MHKILHRKLRVFFLATIFVVPTALLGQATYKWDIACASTTATPHTGVCTGNDYAKGTTVDGRGNSYNVGSFTGTTTFGPNTLTSSGGNDVFIEKVNSAGVIQWAVMGNGSNDDDAKSVAVYSDLGGGVNTYVTGYYQGSITFTSTNASTVTLNAASGNSMDHDMYIVKYNDAGVIQWGYSLGNATSTDWHIGYDIVVRKLPPPNGTAYIWVAGSYMGTTSFGTGYNMANGGSNQNGFLACYADGPTAPAGANWAITTTSTNVCQTLGVDVDETGNAYITGYNLGGTNATFSQTTGGSTAVTPNGNDDGFVAKYGPSGLLLFADNFGSTSGSVGTIGRGIAAAEDGFVYVVGSFTNMSSFLGATSLTSAGGADGFLMRLNSACALQYVVKYGGTGDDHGARVVVDNCGKRCYVTGDFTGTCSFGTPTLVSSGSSDAFLGDFTASTGIAINLTHGGGTGADLGTDVSVNSVEDILYCGYNASNPCSFSGGGSTNLTNGGASDAFVARWDDSNWPALETSAGKAENQGASIVACTDYAVGDMTGASVQFGGTTISSSQTNSGSAYTSDIYLVACDKYATYNSFVRLTSGQSAETSKNISSSASLHYVAGSALTGPNQTGVTFVGATTNNFTSSLAVSNAIVIETNLAGTVQWATSVRANNASSAAFGEGVAYDATGNVYFCGWYSGAVTVFNAGNTSYTILTSTGSNDIFVIKYDASGAVQWAKSFGSSHGDDKSFSISIDQNSAFYYLTGTFSGTITLAHALTTSGLSDGFVMRGDLTTNGAAINDFMFGTSVTNDQGNDLDANLTTEVYVTGQIGTSVYVASVDLSGTTSPGSASWSVTSSAGTGTGNDIFLGQNAYVYVSGMVTGTSLTFGSLGGISSTGAYVVGITCWNGIATWVSPAYTFATSCNGLAEDTAYINNDYGFIAMFVGKMADAGSSHAYMHKATEEGCELTSRIGHIPEAESVSYVSSSTVYPNPFDNTSTLQLDQSIDPAETPVSILIIDMAGRVVKRMDEITSRETTISAEDLVNGIYFYEVIQNGNSVSTGKIMINK